MLVNLLPTPLSLSPGQVICRLEEVPDGGVRMLSLPVVGGEYHVLVLRSGDECHVYENHCPHFGVPLAARENQLIFKSHFSVTCNTHYARFRWQDGFCESGDCQGESLVAVPVCVADGVVKKS